jgi:hypothetical protein
MKPSWVLREEHVDPTLRLVKVNIGVSGLVLLPITNMQGKNNRAILPFLLY